MEGKELLDKVNISVGHCIKALIEGDSEGKSWKQFLHFVSSYFLKNALK